MSEKEAAYTIRVLGRVAEVPQPVWDALVGEDSSPFVEFAWLDALERTGCVGGQTGWTPAHLSLWRDDVLVAVAPSYVKENSEGEFVFDWNWADAAHRMGIHYYPKMVVAVPFTPATGDRVLVRPGEDRAAVARVMAVAARDVAKALGLSGVHVLFPREEEAESWYAQGYRRREGVQYHWSRDGAATFDDYLATFDSKQRNQIKRELRRVREAGIVVETLSPEGCTRQVAHAMHGFYQSTVDKHGPWGRLYLNLAFFETVAEVFRHRLAWVVARAEGATGTDGGLVGGAFNVFKGKTMYGRYWGAGVDVPNLHFVICYYEGIRACLERGIDLFEGGAGRDEHKRSRGFRPVLTRSAHWLADGRMLRALDPWLEQERRRVRQLLTQP